MTRPRIVVIGSSNTDLIVTADRIPSAGETVLGTSLTTAAGGKGANQAVAAARLGADVTLVARIGRDAFGDAALAALAREGVRTDFVVRDDDAPSGVALIVVDGHGENAIAVAPGANALLSEGDVRRAREPIVAADAVLLQLEVPLATVECAARLAADGRAHVVLNPAPARPLTRGLLAVVTVLTPNRTESETLAAMPVTDAHSADRAAQALCEKGVANVVVTLGAGGAVFAGGMGAGRVPGVPVDAVDSTAAGDAFSAAIAVALAKGEALADAVRLATLAGALTVTRVGAQPSLPSIAEVNALARERALLQ